MANPDCITIEQKMKTTAARCPIPQKGMMNNRYEKPVQSTSRGTEMAKHNCVTIEQRMKTTPAEVCWNLADKAEPSRCQETGVAAEGAGTGGTTNEWDRSIDCNKRSTTVRTLPTKCDEFMEPISDRVSPVVTETESWNLADKAEPSRCQETGVAAEGGGTGGTTNERDRSIDCNKRSTTVRTLPTKCDEFMELISDRVSPVVTETAPADGTGVMQYQWDDRDL